MQTMDADLKLADNGVQHQWSSDRVPRCHRCDAGAIPSGYILSCSWGSYSFSHVFPWAHFRIWASIFRPQELIFRPQELIFRPQELTCRLQELFFDAQDAPRRLPEMLLRLPEAPEAQNS